MRILITGGAGFIGYHITKKLVKDQHEITIVDNFSRGVKDKFLKELTESGKVILKEINLLKPEELDKLGDGFNQIYHLAAIIGVQNVLNKPYNVLKDNVLLLLNLIEFAKKQKSLKRFIFASTSEIYAGTLQFYGLEIPTKEETPLTITPLEHPRTSYMLSKIYGEALLNQSGLPYTIVRPHNFYGPRMGMSHVIPELLRKAFYDEGMGLLQVYSAAHKRTFCYIDDAIEIIVRLANNDGATGKAFNIGNESPEVTMEEVAETVLRVTGKNLRITPLPPSPGSPERRCPSLAKTRLFSSYEPKISLPEGIKRTYEWYLRNIFNGNEICEK